MESTARFARASRSKQPVLDQRIEEARQKEVHAAFRVRNMRPDTSNGQLGYFVETNLTLPELVEKLRGCVVLSMSKKRIRAAIQNHCGAVIKRK